MSRSTLEIFKKLPQTNCSTCLLPSCLAFASALMSGRKKVIDYPDLSPERVAELSAELFTLDSMEIEQAEFVD
jgi:CO dehydrogenase/acetyl-CoA synthase gamma subunit (corrinoid Fe-S protein)